jgi:hypothetical protein
VFRPVWAGASGTMRPPPGRFLPAVDHQRLKTEAGTTAGTPEAMGSLLRIDPYVRAIRPDRFPAMHETATAGTQGPMSTGPASTRFPDDAWPWPASCSVIVSAGKLTGETPAHKVTSGPWLKVPTGTSAPAAFFSHAS